MKRSKFDFIKHRRGKAQQRVQEDVSGEVMWPRDILVPLFKNVRIATYSYKSDWRDRAVKTTPDQCAEQFLNILHQHRQTPQVSKPEVVSISVY